MLRTRTLSLIVFIGLAAGLFADSEKNIGLTLIGRFVSGAPSTANTAQNPLELAGSEIAAYDPSSRRLFITNAFDNTVDIVSIADPSNPIEVGEIDLDPYGALVNSVAVRNGVVAVAVEASPKTANGKVAFFNTNGDELAAVTVGALPDMLTFTPDGRAVLVANEGEPSTYAIAGNDPEGSVSIIRLPKIITSLSQSDVTTARFTAFNGTALDPSIRIFGPNATVAQDLEPEYIAVSDDSKTAWVTLQENNAIAELDLESATFVRIIGLGTKDHSAESFGLDGSDEDGPGTGATSRRFNVARWPVQGMYMPDAIASYRIKGQTFLLTANEGDVRDWPGMPAEAARLSSLAAFLPPCTGCLEDVNGIRRLTVSRIGANPTSSFTAPIQRLLAHGARSFSIWTTDGERVFDSGDQFEQITAARLPANTFNSNHSSNSDWDTRSDDKGPEPEGITVAKLWGRWFAFIALERIGGIMVYDVTDPQSPRFVDYVNSRDFSGSPVANTAGDLGPEMSLVIPTSDSPTHEPLLVVANEASGSTAIFRIAKAK